MSSNIFKQAQTVPISSNAIEPKCQTTKSNGENYLNKEKLYKESQDLTFGNNNNPRLSILIN